MALPPLRDDGIDKAPGVHQDNKDGHDDKALPGVDKPCAGSELPETDGGEQDGEKVVLG
ncbi:hypothetical protein HK405_008116, partial [Cladochytrium tenue]